MDFEVYCDEAHPDVLSSSKPRARYLMIGSLWLPARLRDDLKQEIHRLRQVHAAWGEIKWNKVSPNRQDFYLALVDMFARHSGDLRFRCIAVDHAQVNLDLHDQDGELGFYKFYYHLLHHWIHDFNRYQIFCDAKTNHDPARLPVLRRCLAATKLTAEVAQVQSLPSREVVLIQLADLLLGAASSRLNNTLGANTAKAALVARLEQVLGHRLAPTSKTEEKFNVFRIRLQGGR